jgi:hypothetical protein
LQRSCFAPSLTPLGLRLTHGDAVDAAAPSGA